MLKAPNCVEKHGCNARHKAFCNARHNIDVTPVTALHNKLIEENNWKCFISIPNYNLTLDLHFQKILPTFVWATETYCKKCDGRYTAIS